MRVEGKSTRFYERTRIEIPLEVNYSENSENTWCEQTRLLEATICGCGFMLSRPVEPNRLIHLKMPLPRQFRLYDLAKANYEVWGVIRHVELLAPNVDGRISLKIGAALTGGAPPASFRRDPTTLYDLKPILRKGSFWDLREMPRKTGRYIRIDEERETIEKDIVLGMIGADGQITETVAARTINVSESGMAVSVRLSSECSHFVLVKTVDSDLCLLAMVRGARALDEDGNSCLHLELIGGKWMF